MSQTRPNAVIADRVTAIKNLDIALRFNPRYARARASRGIALFVTGKRAEGIAEIERALREKPDMDDARLDLAECRKLQGDLTGALAEVREVLRRAPADWPKRLAAQQLEQALRAPVPRS